MVAGNYSCEGIYQCMMKRAGNSTAAATSSPKQARKSEPTRQCSSPAILRVKLTEQISAQMESGIKLSLHHSCPPTRCGNDQSIHLYHPALGELIRKWQEIRRSVGLGQHHVALLETHVDLVSNSISYVAIEFNPGPSGTISFRQTRLDMLATVAVQGGHTIHP